jgi:glutaredoxin 3
LLRQKSVAYTEIDITGDARARRLMIEQSGRQTVPQIFAGVRHLGGCDDLYALERAGRLDSLLAG